MGLENVCMRCSAEVRFVITLGDGRIKINPTPTPAGNVILVEVGGRVRARVLTGPEMPAQQEAFRQHKCPKPERPGPPCATCGWSMHRGLAELMQWTTHPAPGCDTTYLADLARLNLGRAKR